MNKKTDKAQLSEFDQKLQESMSDKHDSVSSDDRIPISRKNVTPEHDIDSSIEHDTGSRPRAASAIDEPRVSNREERDFPQHEDYATIPVIEEQINVDKKIIETGRVHISKKVHQEEVSVDIPTIDEEVDIRRVEVNQIIESEPPPIRYEGDTTIIPVLREVSVVVKRLMLVEELHVTKRRVETPATQQVTLRKEEVIVTKTDATNSSPDEMSR